MADGAAGDAGLIRPLPREAAVTHDVRGGAGALRSVAHEQRLLDALSERGLDGSKHPQAIAMQRKEITERAWSAAT